MQVRMQNLPIGQRIALALALPIAGFLFFAMWVLVSHQRTANEMRSLREVAELATSVSGLVHELQRERGMSVAFLGSGGTAFAEQQSARQAHTDAQKAGFEEALQQIVLERSPRPPSEMLDVEAARLRQDSPEALRRALRGDLDRIILHALRAAPEERYPTANAFRDDLLAWLDCRPVQAVGQGRVYRARKFVQSDVYKRQFTYRYTLAFASVVPEIDVVAVENWLFAGEVMVGAASVPASAF